MIAYLKGKVLFRASEWVALNVGGVGYEVFPTHLDELAVGQDVHLWIYTSVREDAIQLYGFETMSEREVFLALLKVSGIGPKLAVRILTACPWQRLLSLIDMGDATALTAIPKVGRKTAEQIIVELKGKSYAGLALTQEDPSAPGPTRREITSALVNLGYRPADVDRVVRGLAPNTSLEQGVREGLQKLSHVE